ncbi:MAG: LmeA family phospholipid-binding protein, partial [Armatimonadetes bacterium]|nr:LmeA family phospholipid-binding protein [Armatimonadota bacterium]
MGGGIADFELRRFERLGAADLASRLHGEGKQVNVDAEVDGIVGALAGRLSYATLTASKFTVDGMPVFLEAGTQRGSIGTLKLRFTDFSIRGLRVESLEADIPGCRFDLGSAQRKRKIKLTRSGVGTATARITETALADYIRLKYPAVKEVTVELKKHRAFVTGRAELLLLKTDFFVIASLVPQAGTQLWLEDAIVFLNDERVRDGSERRLLDTLNPVVDANRDLGLRSALVV